MTMKGLTARSESGLAPEPAISRPVIPRPVIPGTSPGVTVDSEDQ